MAEGAGNLIPSKPLFTLHLNLPLEFYIESIPPTYTSNKGCRDVYQPDGGQKKLNVF